MRNGFTLVEISIGLVIIGLVIGGVFVGRDLIERAKLRSLISQLDEFSAAVQTFRVKYNCLPGDCPNASTFGLGNNGNGNGVIPIGNLESFQAFKHLGGAGLIEGNYTGLSGPLPNCGFLCDAVVGENVPTTAFNNVSFLFVAGSQISDSNGFLAAQRADNFLTLGTDGTAYGYTNEGFLTGIEGRLFDEKIDDGSPLTGKLSPWKRNSCTNNTNNTTAVYNTSTSSTLRCSFFLRLAM
mgnify:CR=1 FL=1